MFFRGERPFAARNMRFCWQGKAPAWMFATPDAQELPRVRAEEMIKGVAILTSRV